MMRWLVFAVLAGCAWALPAQAPAGRPKFDAFEVATVKPVGSDAKSGRYIKMVDDHRFVAKDYTLKLLIAAAYELNPKTISGGAGWAGDDHYDIEAVTGGDVRPTHDEQMKMLRALLSERFHLTFHREPKEFSIYALEVAKSGAKLTATATPNAPPVMGPGVVHPQQVVLPARNATVGDLASLLQRAVLDRPVVDRTELGARYDFDLEWAPDESQFGGDVTATTATSPSPPLFQAIQEQLGLVLRATKAPVSALVMDGAEKPSAN